MTHNKKEIHLLDILTTLVRHRWIILRNLGITLFAVILISFLLPKSYMAVTTLMPPREEEKLSVSSVLSEVPVPGLALSSNISSADILVEILNSRSVGVRMLKRSFVHNSDTLTLQTYLKAGTDDEGLETLHKTAHFILSKKGIITIRVELSDPDMAAAAANAFTQELDWVNQEKSVSRAKNSRIYIESQLKETQQKLSEATHKLAEFQQIHRAVSLEEQLRSAIQLAGTLKGQIIAREVELGNMLRSMKRENPLVIRAENELDELRRKYNELQVSKSSEEVDLYLPFSEVPEVSIELAELLREAKVQETLWEMLNQQFYRAKIEEARDTPTVQVLDRAVPPAKPSAPNRKLLIIVFALLSIVFSVLWVFGVEYFRRPSEQRQKILGVINEFRKDVEMIKDKLTSPVKKNKRTRL